MEPVAVRILTAPDTTCGGATWSDAVGMIRGRLARRFGDAVAVEHITLFSPRFFEIPELAAALGVDAQVPVIAIGTEVVSSGGKLSEPRIAEALRSRGVREVERSRA